MINNFNCDSPEVLRYELTCTELELQEENNKRNIYTTFGIAALSSNGNVFQQFQDISPNEIQVAHLAELLNRDNAPLNQFEDLVCNFCLNGDFI